MRHAKPSHPFPILNCCQVRRVWHGGAVCASCTCIFHGRSRPWKTHAAPRAATVVTTMGKCFVGKLCVSTPVWKQRTGPYTAIPVSVSFSQSACALHVLAFVRGDHVQTVGKKCSSDASGFAWLWSESLNPWHFQWLPTNRPWWLLCSCFELCLILIVLLHTLAKAESFGSAWLRNKDSLADWWLSTSIFPAFIGIQQLPTIDNHILSIGKTHRTTNDSIVSLDRLWAGEWLPIAWLPWHLQLPLRWRHQRRAQQMRRWKSKVSAYERLKEGQPQLIQLQSLAHSKSLRAS